MHTSASEVKEADMELFETTDASLLATRMEAGEEVLVHYGQFPSLRPLSLRLFLFLSYAY